MLYRSHVGAAILNLSKIWWESPALVLCILHYCRDVEEYSLQSTTWPTNNHIIDGTHCRLHYEIDIIYPLYVPSETVADIYWGKKHQ